MTASWCRCTRDWVRVDCDEHGDQASIILSELGRSGGKISRSLTDIPWREPDRPAGDGEIPVTPPTFEAGEDIAREKLWLDLHSNDHRIRQAAAVKWLEYAKGKPGQVDDSEDLDAIRYESAAIIDTPVPPQSVDELADALAAA